MNLNPLEAVRMRNALALEIETVGYTYFGDKYHSTDGWSYRKMYELVHRLPSIFFPPGSRLLTLQPHLPTPDEWEEMFPSDRIVKILAEWEQPIKGPDPKYIISRLA